VPATPRVKADDPRPPYVTVELAPYEVTELTSAEAEVKLAEAELDLAKKKLEIVQSKMVAAHRLKGEPEMVFCNETGYRGHIERKFVVWVLGVTECRGL